VAHRREMAMAMCAHAALDPNAIDTVKQTMADTGSRRGDCAVDCAAKEHTTNWAIQASRNGGRVVLTGIHSDVLVPFEVSPMRRKELTIFNVRRSLHESETAIALITENTKWFAPLITHTRPLAEIADAFRIAETYSDGVGKMVIV